MDIEGGKVIEFVPEDSSSEWFVLSDGDGNRISEQEFDTYGSALQGRVEALDSGEYSEVHVNRVSDVF